MLRKIGGLRDRVRETLQFLKGAGPELLDMFYEKAEFVQIRAGQHILTEGAECNMIIFLLSGSARAYKLGENGREITLYRIKGGEGCVLAASCILNHTPYPVFAVAEFDLEALIVAAPVFRCWVQKYAFWRDYVFGLMSQRITSVIMLIEEIAFRRMDTRISEYLIQKMDVVSGKLQTTHQQIAADLGTSREVVSRILKDFEHRGWIVLSRNIIQIKDSDALGVPVH